MFSPFLFNTDGKERQINGAESVVEDA